MAAFSRRGSWFAGGPRRVKRAHGSDACEDAWTPMPDMVVERKGHRLVAVGSKLSVIIVMFACAAYDVEKVRRAKLPFSH